MFFAAHLDTERYEMDFGDMDMPITVTNDHIREPVEDVERADDAPQVLLDHIQQNSFALMWTLKRHMDETFRALELKPFEVLALELLTKGARYPKDLAEALDAAPPVISALLRELEARGLLERHLDPDDHRRVFLVLTPAGREVHARAKRIWYASQRERLAQLSLEQLQTLAQIQRALLEER